MNSRGPLSFEGDFLSLSEDPTIRHERYIDYFGQFIFWIRNSSLSTSRTLVESNEKRNKLGTIRREPYEGVAALTPEQREAAMSLAKETLDGFIERLIWSLGDEGTDAKLGSAHAYRFRIVMEVVDAETEELADEEVINRGGRFFGSYWGRWLNRFGKGSSSR